MSKKKIKIKSVPTKQLSRKELRKQKTQNKMEKKRLFFSNKTQGKQLVAAAAKAQLEQQTSAKKSKKKKKKQSELAPEDIPIEQLLSGDVDSEMDESIASDFSDDEVDARMSAQIAAEKKAVKISQTTTTEKKIKKLSAQRPDVAETHRRELQRQKELGNAARKQRIKQMKQENEEEDKVIARLEKKLKLNKSKDKNRLVRKMFNDGLDYALEMCLDDEEEEEKRQLKEKRKQEQERQANSWSDEEDDNGEMFGDEVDDEDESAMVNDEDDVGSNEDDEEADSGDGDSDSEEEVKFKEDIYGRKRDKDGNVIRGDPAATGDAPQKYLPPHLRALQASQADDKQAQLMERLRKHCKGLLNRLSEANLHKIANGIEELYQKHARYNVNETLTSLLSEALIGRTICNERMVQEHMVLLAYLHAQIGSEIGAHFLQHFIKKFDEFVLEIDALQVEDKRLNNLVLLLAYMYIFKIYEHRLLLQIIGKLAERLGEKAIECLLLIFQSVGFKLRKDDPLAFKQMMLHVQQQIAAAPLELKENLRLKFMVDILNAVKNNNINKIPQFDAELAENLRKRLKAMLRHDKYVITLNITLEDLLRADQVGKWWVVGSAWSGNMDDLGAAQQNNKNETTAGGQRYSEQLLALARKQKMNTDERRNIFCIVMSAEDYVDAFEKILHLSLKDQRSVAYVILHCCLNEQHSNPYYAHLALKFCHYNRKYQLAFQFAAWDRINDIGALSRQQLKNLAQFLQTLILNGGLQLSVLKVVDFLQLNKSSLLFMREVMLGLLLHDNEQRLQQVFERVAKQNKLQQFKQSIRLFMQHFLLQQQQQQQEKSKLTEEQLALLRKRVDYADNLLAYVDL